MTKIYRVVVRGQFADLDEPTRERLLADADEHDIFRSAFTADGTLTYDRRLVAFNARYEVRVANDLAEASGGDGEAAAVTDGIARTARRLTEAGIGHKHLRATATDMATLWTS